jgi:peroxiredoxin
VLAIVLLLASVACLDTDSGAGGGPRSVAPAFSLPALDGREIGLAAQLGKIVIVDFWATWCTPCEAQMPVLDTLWAEEGGDGLEVIGVSVDTSATPEIEAWVAERGFRYPIVLGDQELAMRYGVIGFPTLFVIDPAGKIHTRHTGVLDRPELDEILESIRLEFRPADGVSG